MNIEIANKLVKLRKDKGLSQEELADKIGISRQAVSKWERAESSPDTDNLIALAKLYGISLDDMLLLQDEKKESTDTSQSTVSDEFNSDQSNNENEHNRKGGMFLFPYPIVVVILYFVFTLTNSGWGFAWLIFLTIPLYYGIAEMVYQQKRNSSKK